ncbi:hypothetical protein CR203_18710 [Salipaludibacillus neizhouensis]|uniref:Uncharacterized protein n=1 Tax=Salipaludibacillus neizhouensis TaxID=885475 RepID=A0A3A9K5X7_9BACI|nr:hypothetical protein [Salipaludibacillus neizhouensis]RKL65882.1 hypothetical protein CR203_18710 [Salipaludibacillus neizhouensis]
MKKTTVLSIIIGIIILMLIGLILPKYEEMLDFFNVKWILIYSILLSLLYFLFGILIETKRLIKVFSKKVRVNWLQFSFVVILILLVFVPTAYWLMLFPHNFLISFISKLEIQVILNVLAGILFVRSFYKEI